LIVKGAVSLAGEAFVGGKKFAVCALALAFLLALFFEGTLAGAFSFTLLFTGAVLNHALALGNQLFIFAQHALAVTRYFFAFAPELLAGALSIALAFEASVFGLL
jgi:hypothetical protein